MKQPVLILAALVASLWAAGPVPAQQILYFGKMEGGEAQGLIQLHGQYFAVAQGDELPGVGTVDSVTDDVLIVRRTLTEQEKEQLRGEGRAVHDAEERHILNVSRFLGGSRSRGPR